MFFPIPCTNYFIIKYVLKFPTDFELSEDACIGACHQTEQFWSVLLLVGDFLLFTVDSRPEVELQSTSSVNNCTSLLWSKQWANDDCIFCIFDLNITTETVTESGAEFSFFQTTRLLDFQFGNIV